VVYVLERHVELSETFVSNEIAELRRQGVRVEVLVLNEGDAGRDPTAVYLFERFTGKARLGRAHAAAVLRHPLRYIGFVRAVLAMRGEAVPWRNLPAAAEELEGAVARVHAHFAWRAAAAAIPLARLLGVPCSVTVHARDVFADRRHVPFKLGAVDRIVTVCEYNRRWLQQHDAPRPPISVVVCGVVPPTDEPMVDQVVDVLAVGRLVPKKGFDVLVDAVALLVPIHPELRVEILGEGELRGSLGARIRSLGLEGNVHLRGATPHAEVLARIREAKIVAVPARIAPDGDRDSMPVIAKEAMARGRPVVASDLVGIPEMVDERCGRLVRPEDPEALAEALAELLGDPGLRARLGAAGRVRVEREFALADHVRHLAALFNGASE
jgi:glycosyltransferase involved in cell wall biosynthesis